MHSPAVCWHLKNWFIVAKMRKKKKWRESEGEEREWGGEKERSRERDYRMNRIQSPTP